MIMIMYRIVLAEATRCKFFRPQLVYVLYLWIRMCAASRQHWQPSQENWSRWESHFIDADLEMVSPGAHVTVKSVLYKEPTRLHRSASHDAVVQVAVVCVFGVCGPGQTQGDVETAMSPSLAGVADAVSPNTRPLHQAMANPMAQPSSLPITPQTEDTR